MVKSDTVIETHHFRRVIRVKDGPVIETKKKDYWGRIKFKVKDISVFWREGEPVEYIVVWGKALNDKKLQCNRRYEPDKIPDEIRAILGDNLMGKK